MSHLLQKKKNTAPAGASAPFFPPGLIFPKLTVNAPNDHYEQEANAMAKKVMTMPDQGTIQRKCASCQEDEKLQRQPMEEEEEPIQMQIEEEEEMLQTKPEGGGLTPSSKFQSKLYQSKGGGIHLPGNINSIMSQAFKRDFSKVKVHNGSTAAKLNQSIGARAFTHGSDIYFNQGAFQPDHNQGKQLIAHELTHVVQQTKDSTPSIQKQALTNTERHAYVTNIIAEMGTTHSDYNDGAQDADAAISAEAQARADLAKALLSISMAVVVPGFGGVITNIAGRFGVAISSGIADHIGGVIGEAAKVAGESEINRILQSTEQNELFVTIANGLEEAARIKRQYLVDNQYNPAIIPDQDLVELHDYWVALARNDRNTWNEWFQEKYQEFLGQVSPIGERTEQRYGTNKLRWVEGDHWRALALTGEGRYFMANGRPTFMSWISPFYREYAIRRHESALGTDVVSAVHYTQLETEGRVSRGVFENLLNSPNPGYGNIVYAPARGDVPESSGSYCPSCQGKGGGVGPEQPGFDFEQFDLQGSGHPNAGEVDTEALRRWIESIEAE